MKYERHPNHSCKMCEKPVYVRPGVLAKSKSGFAFCGNDCYGKFCRRPVPCSICGAEMLRGKNAKTCSKQCANKLKIGTSYSAGRPRKDKVSTYQAIRTRMIEAKGPPKCGRCGYEKIPGVVVIHHIVERCEGGSDEIENLEFLCPTCHSEEHYLRREAKRTSKENAGVGSPNELEARSDL